MSVTWPEVVLYGLMLAAPIAGTALGFIPHSDAGGALTMIVTYILGVKVPTIPKRPPNGDDK